MSGVSESEKLRQECLLVEYQLAHREVERLNRQLWTTGQILIPLSLAGLTLFSMLTEHSLETVSRVFFTGVVSSLLLLGWHSIAKKWFAYQTISQYRIVEIEKELSLWCTRYELYGSVKRNPLKTFPIFDDEDLNRLKSIPEDILPTGNSVSGAIRNLVILMITGWVFLLIREIVLAYNLLECS